MIKICVYLCLLSALSIVEMTPIYLYEPVGENVTIKCSGWRSVLDVTPNDKYFCYGPCKENEDVIITAAFGETTHKDRIQLNNSADGLLVTFTNLQKSDSKTYFCGVERFGFDAFIKVTLEVIDAESSHPTAPSTTAVINSSTLPSIITNMSTPNIIYSTKTTTSSTTQGAGSVPYLIIGAIVLIITLMVLLMPMRKTMKRRPKEDNAQEDVKNEEMRPEDQQTINQPTLFSTLYFPADPDSLYANCSYHHNTKLAAESSNSKDLSFNSTSSSEITSRGPFAESRDTDYNSLLVYSVVQLPTGQTESNENDPLYSLAQ